MNTIPKCKHGDCSVCGAKNTSVVKIKKDLYCLSCNRALKTGQQITKAQKRDKLRQQSSSTPSTKKNLVAAVSKLSNAEDTQRLNSLDAWFKERMKTQPVMCENCGATSIWLENNKEGKGKSRWKSCQAHLLPKRHFESIMKHPLNGMVLGSGFSMMCNCHDTYDSNWSAASKMKIWDEVVKRFKILYPLITQEEHQFIPDILLQEVNQV